MEVERKMAYNKFTLSQAEKQFQLRIDETQDLFSAVEEVKISGLLATILEGNVPLALAINTEKARSEMIITPILLEFRNRAEPPISLFSGRPFNKPIVQKRGYFITGKFDQFKRNIPYAALIQAFAGC